MKNSVSIYFMALAVLAISCNSNAPSTSTDDVLNNSEIFGDQESQQKANTTSDVHKVTVLEILPTEKYNYMRVAELGTEYWIAALKTDIEIGANYYITGGLQKKNFESKEYNRVFEDLVLVDNLVPEKHGAEHNSSPQPNDGINYTISADKRVKESVLIASIVDKPEDFAGKKVTIQGTCTKVNEGILGTNWVHINDGTNNGFDFTATTLSNISVGKQVILEGTIVLNKDFGAGYVYEIILENCKPLN